jgi:hypothetical protein
MRVKQCKLGMVVNNRPTILRLRVRILQLPERDRKKEKGIDSGDGVPHEQLYCGSFSYKLVVSKCS